MKSEANIAQQVFPGHAELSSQKTSNGQGYENQEAIKGKCFHPTGTFIEFKKEEIEQPIGARFETIVRKYPHHLAVKIRDHSLTYEQLNRAANRLSRNIVSILGSEQEPVALLLKQSVFLAVVLLAILKAKKFYVPLDPSYPLRRNKFVLENSATRLIVTDKENFVLAQELSNNAVHILKCDDIVNYYGDEDLPVVVSPNDIAWLLYTSGTTGEPKGVIQNHRNVLQFVRNYSNAIHVCSEDRMSLLRYASSFGATRDIFAAILNGASLYINDVKNEGVAFLADWLHKERITICFFGSPLFRSFVDAMDETEAFPDLRLIRLGSDTVRKSDVEAFQKRFSPQCILVNGLSSTETATVCRYFITKETQVTTETVPIGYAVENTELLLLDDDGKQVGLGEIGTIAVKSRHLALRYWRQPELTRSVFAEDAEANGLRIYRTGDLGRRTAGGLLEHLGRTDFQVKVRGYRVEIAEIESVLLTLEHIKNVVVVLHNDSAGEAQLVAYVVPDVHPGPTIDKLRKELRGLLPDYMIPSILVVMDSLPVNYNGKIDLRALPNPDRLRPHLNIPFVEPKDAVEKKLIKIWSEVLGIDQIGVRDDFFDLGGHSLLAAKLFGRIKKILGKDLSPPTLLYARTIEKLAAIVRQDNTSAPRSLLVPLQPKGTKPPLFWTGGFTSDIYLPRHLAGDQPVYGLLNQCHNGHTQLYSRLEDIAAHHLREIRAVQPHGPYYLGGVCFGGLVAFEMAQQLKNQGEDIALLFLVDLVTLLTVNALTDRLAECPKELSKIESFPEKILRHLGALAILKPRNRFTYVWIRVVHRIKALISITYRDLLCKGCLLIGWPIPVFCQARYMVKVDRQVKRDYQPRPYSGLMVHIKAEASTYNPHLVAMLSAGQLESYEVRCTHHELLKEPHIAIWAKELRAYLQKAHTASQGFNPSRSTREAGPATRLKQETETLST